MTGATQDYPFIREMRPPVTEEQLRPLDLRCRVVQFSEPLSGTDFARIAGFMRKYPQVTLRVYGHWEQGLDLEFLRYFPFLRSFEADAFGLESFDGLRHLPDQLDHLGLGQTRSMSFSLAFLERFGSLRELFIEGHRTDLEVVGSLSSLAALTLQSITLPNLSILRPLGCLLSLALKLGGTTDLNLLPEVGRLRYLEIWRVKGLTDLRAVGRVRTLQYLFLQSLKKVPELPSLGALSLLRRVHLEALRWLGDLQPVANAPALEELLVFDMPNLRPAAFKPFVRHPTLKAVSAGLGSIGRNRAVKSLLRLPEAERGKHQFVFA